MFDFKDKKVLIIGGTSGIGLATAIAFANHGADVVATSRDAKLVNETAQQLMALGSNTFEITCDATNSEDVQRLMEQVESRWRTLDVVMNSQGAHHKIPSEAVSDEQFASLMDVNLQSVFRVCREAFPLLSKPQGTIINIASMGAFLGLKHAAAYSASKGAIVQLSKTLAVDWAEYGIRINCIAPGWILTRLSEQALSVPAYREPILRRIPLARFGQPEEVADVALFLASQYARYMTGSVIAVDGGVLASV